MKYQLFIDSTQVSGGDEPASHSLLALRSNSRSALVTQLSNTLTSFAVVENVTFPYFTLEQFEVIGGFVDGMGGIMCTAFAPLVTVEGLKPWEEYSVKNQGWIQVSKHLKEVEQFHQDALHGTIQDHEHDRRLQRALDNDTISPVLYRFENGTKVRVVESIGGIHAPIWQVTPPYAGTVNLDLLQDPFTSRLYDQMRSMNRSVLSSPTPITDMFDFLFDPEEEALKPYPYAFILQPVFDSYEANKTLVGVLIAVTSYENLLDKLVPAGTSGIVCVIRESCGGGDISFRLEGREATFLGYGDFHDPRYESYKVTAPVELYENKTDGVCLHTLDIYPTAALQASYETNKPAVYTSVVALAFLVTTALLVVYDRLVTRRQEKTMASAIRSGKLVASLFPSNVVDRVMQDGQSSQDGSKKKGLDSLSDESESGFYKSRPIADFCKCLRQTKCKKASLFGPASYAPSVFLLQFQMQR
jgi:hypothetical protein